MRIVGPRELLAFVRTLPGPALAPLLISAVFNVVMLFGVLTFVWLMFFEPAWLTYENLPFPAKLPAVRQGEVAPLEVVRCNSSGFKRTYQLSHGMRNLDTGELMVMPGVVAELSPGCTRDTSFVNRVPKTAPPGKYQAVGTAEVKKTLRTVYVEWYSEPFEVIPADSGKP